MGHALKAVASERNRNIGLGYRVRAVREAMGLSLRDLSDRCGVSAPMLSQVERDETSPTLAVAERISAGLDLSLSQLLRLGESVPVAVVRKGERQKGHSTGGHSFEMITPEKAGQRYLASLHRLKKGASTGGIEDPPMHEPGSRETLFVQKGKVSLLIEGTEHVIEQGDAVTFEADLPHCLKNVGHGEAEFLAVVSSGLRQTQ